MCLQLATASLARQFVPKLANVTVYLLVTLTNYRLGTGPHHLTYYPAIITAHLYMTNTQNKLKNSFNGIV